MNCNRRGFALYFTFVVTSVLFFLNLGGFNVVLSSMDMSRSCLLETISFHSADGGLEVGLARVKKYFSPFKTTFRRRISLNRDVEVVVYGEKDGSNIDIYSTANVFEGNKLVATRKLSRRNVGPFPGRLECGIFSEEP